MLSCMLALSALSFLSPTILSFSYFHGLVVRGWGLWTDRVSSLSPGLAQRTQIDNKKNNNNQCHCGTILLTLYSMVRDRRVSRAGPLLFHWPTLIDPFLSSAVFPYLFFLSIGW